MSDDPRDSTSDRERALATLRKLADDSVSEEVQLQAAQMLLYESKGGADADLGLDELADKIGDAVAEKLRDALKAQAQRAAHATR